MSERPVEAHAGWVAMRRARLRALLDQVSRELVLAQGYPDVLARLQARRLRAQLELDEMPTTILAASDDVF